MRTTMFTNNGSLYDLAFSLGRWNRQPDPDLERRKDGRRKSGETMEDFVLPIIENGRKYQGYMPGGTIDYYIHGRAAYD